MIISIFVVFGFFFFLLNQAEKSSNDSGEFADMWKELKLRESSPPDSNSNNNTPGQKMEDALIKVNLA